MTTNTKLIIGSSVLISGLILFFKPFPFQKKMYIKNFNSELSAILISKYATALNISSEEYKVLINSVDKLTTKELNDVYTYIHKYQKNNISAPIDLLNGVNLIAKKYYI